MLDGTYWCGSDLWPTRIVCVAIPVEDVGVPTDVEAILTARVAMIGFEVTAAARVAGTNASSGQTSWRANSIFRETTLNRDAVHYTGDLELSAA